MKKKFICFILIIALVSGFSSFAADFHPNNIVLVAAGSKNSYVLKSDGSIWGWGDNASGQLGVGVTSTLVPKEIFGADCRKVVAGTDNVFAIKANKELWAIGRNDKGQIGNGQTTNCSAPVKILDNVVQVASGETFTIALDADGKVWSWGNNADGQLGDGTLVSKHTPAMISGIQDVVSISVGKSHALAIDIFGDLYVWGSNTSGQLGHNSIDNYDIPFVVLNDVKSASAGSNFTVAVKTANTLWSWGSNANCVLMSNDTSLVDTVPQQRSIIGFVSVIAGENHVTASKADGSLWTWGDSQYGQLGDGIGIGKLSTPVEIINTNTRQVSAYNHTIVLKKDGKVFAFGLNQYGQLGDETKNNQRHPVIIFESQYAGVYDFGDFYEAEDVVESVDMDATEKEIRTYASLTSMNIYASLNSSQTSLGINLNTETVINPDGIPILGFSFNAGKSWKKGVISTKRLESAFKKGFTLWICDKVTDKKIPADGANIYKFMPVKERPRVNTLVPNYKLAHVINNVFNFDLTTANRWTLIPRDNNMLDYGLIDTMVFNYTLNNKKPVEDTWYYFPRNGVRVADLQTSGKKIKKTFIYKLAPVIKNDYAIPASKSRTVTPKSTQKPDTVRIRYDSEKLFPQVNMFFNFALKPITRDQEKNSINLSEIFIDNIDVISYGSFVYRVAPSDKKPASPSVTYTFAPRAAIDSSLSLSCANGKISTKTTKYEVFNGAEWDVFPKISSEATSDLSIRLRSTAKSSGKLKCSEKGIWTTVQDKGYATSKKAVLTYSWGVVDTKTNANGVLSATITP